jgi:site-specific recombinase XerD
MKKSQINDDYLCMGLSLEELRALMGHPNIQTTLRYQKVISIRAELVAKQALSHLVKNDRLQDIHC